MSFNSDDGYESKSCKRQRILNEADIAEAEMERGSSAFLDDFISRLLNGKRGSVKPNVTEDEIIQVAKSAAASMLTEPTLLRIRPPVNLCGDIHGQFEDLIRIFRKGGWLPQSKYLFLGDYVDRGEKSVEVISLLMAYKARFPNEIHLLRGNHESKEVNKRYSFYDECVEKYSKKLYGEISSCFNVMPVAAIVGGKIFCVHGGISPNLDDVNMINGIRRPCEVPSRGLVCDLLWSDPSENAEGFEPNLDRGISFIFGADAIVDFLSRNNLELICRAHEVAMKGFKFFKRQRQLVTLFSAPKYDGYNNKGAIMVVSSNLTITFKILT